MGSTEILDCEISNNSGGGIQGAYTNLTISNCTIFENNSDLGGGLYFYDSNEQVAECIIYDNTANKGGGIYLNASSGDFDNCTISTNQANDSGGGIYSYDDLSEIKNCTISQNIANYSGGGINCWDTSPTFTNCIISNNSATSGGAFGCEDSSPIISYCTILLNEASFGGGLGCMGISYPSITNCILWRNNAPEEIFVSSGEPTITYSDIQGDWIGEGNFDLDPFFTDPAKGDYHLTISSPCLDSGIDVGVNDDWDGDTRPYGEDFDIGMDEYYAAESIEVLLLDCPNSVSVNDTLTFTAGVVNTSLDLVQFDQIRLYISGPLTTEMDVYSGSTYTLGIGDQIIRPLSLFVPEIVIAGWYTITLGVSYEETSLSKSSFFIEALDV